jgi:hypothetical protein
MYVLVSENLTELGGAMGTERTYENWRRHFKQLDSAKTAAQKDWDKQATGKVLAEHGLSKELDWIKEGSGCRTADLHWVMYHIKKLRVE